MSVEQRLAAMIRLCRRQWEASGREIVQLPRNEWPGEVFEIAHDRDRG
jgi:hypothetical protein